MPVLIHLKRKENTGADVNQHKREKERRTGCWLSFGPPCKSLY